VDVGDRLQRVAVVVAVAHHTAAFFSGSTS
jgi:hypothetical protein